MKLATLAALAAFARPTAAVTESGNVPSSNGSASDSNRLAPSPGVTQNAPANSASGTGALAIRVTPQRFGHGSVRYGRLGRSQYRM